MIKSKFSVNDEKRNILDKYLYGTAQILEQVSSEEVVLVTAAHNFMYFPRIAGKFYTHILFNHLIFWIIGETTIKYAQESEYFLQHMGQWHKLKFNVIHKKALPNYLTN